jgi:hypothetical protein
LAKAGSFEARKRQNDIIPVVVLGCYATAAELGLPPGPFSASVNNVIACFNYLVAVGNHLCFDASANSGEALCVAGDAKVTGTHFGTLVDDWAYW